MSKRGSTKQPSPRRNALGSAIRRVREEKGWSQSDLARRLQLFGWDADRTVITKIELHRRCITDYELLALAEVLEFSLAELKLPRAKLRPFFASPA